MRIHRRSLLPLFLPTVFLIFASIAANAAYRFDEPDTFLADAENWPAWSQTLQHHSADRDAIWMCVENKDSCHGRLKSLRPVLVRGAALDRDRQLRLVNRYINRRFYRRDRRSTSLSVVAGGEASLKNHWVTLLQFLQRGGDCEDYATAKYFLLRELGVPAEDMRVLVAYERKARGYHAVLAVKQEDGSSWLLESDDTIVRGNQRRYRFIYALNENGIWDHAGR
jgi:predicted transglutaminase-like cysteine proteinase